MKNISLAFLLLLAGNTVFSQTETVINLSGEASKKILPDIAVVNMNVISRDRSENDALTRLNTLTQQIIERIVAAGFSKDQLKITGYSIHPEYEYSSGKRRLNGYSANQGIVLKFKLDKEKLTTLFSKLNQDKLEGFSFYFASEISKDLQKSVKSELIKDALKDAEEKAKLIADASRLKIKSIKQIDYNTPQYAPQPMYKSMAVGSAETMDASPAFANIDVQEIELNESVIVVYVVENINK